MKFTRGKFKMGSRNKYRKYIKNVSLKSRRRKYFESFMADR